MSSELGHEGEAVGARIISRILEDDHAFAEAAADGATADVARDGGQGAAGGGARSFASNADGAAYGKTTWDGAQQGLTGDQRTALYGYSLEKGPGDAGPPDYKEINGYLRGQAPATPEVTSSVDQLDQALSIQPVPENLTVLRETGPSAFDRPVQRLPGSVQHDDAYLSTELGPDPTFDSTRTKPVLHLEVPAGTPAMYMDGVSQFPSERELLLGRGLSYQVERVESIGGRWHIFGRVLP